MQHDFCPLCGSAEFIYEEEYGFYQCEECHNLWGDEDADPDYDEEPLDLGACCACGKEDKICRTIVAVERRASIPGTGWGCLVCGLPSDGAVAILCDDCLGGIKPIRQVCHGYPALKERIDIEQLPAGRFSHIQEMHERDEMGI